ncbi:MAG TPA: hypothetical protein VFN97_21310 [Actinospica sp.]|nr:hypothetical protein [Actinospica sp.]
MDGSVEAPAQPEAPTGSPRRAELLERTLDYAERNSLSEISLRPLAAAIGSSPRVLIYLFGSKDGLLREVLALARARQLAVVRRAMEESAGPGEVLGRLWGWMCEPEHAGVGRLFFESYSRSLGGGEPWATFAVDSVRDWEPPLRSILTTGEGGPPSAAEVTLALATLRGLFLDLLATGEAERIDLAWRRFVGLSWPSTPKTC